MPTSPRRACSHHPCRHFVPCPDHGAPARSGASSRAYGVDHRKMRAHVLAEEPSCPGYGRRLGHCGRPTEHADHIKTLRAGGTSARSNYRGLCGRCHRSKTATEDGAFGNAKKPAPGGARVPLDEGRGRLNSSSRNDG